MSSLVLFTRDLRVHDQPALDAAARAGGSCVPLFVRDQELLQRSPNRSRFLMQSLADLDHALTRLGSPLVMREGDVVARTLDVVGEVKVDEVHLTDDVTGLAQRRERDLRHALAAHGVELHVHPGNAVVEPGHVAPPGKRVYSVFTPYHRAWAQVPCRAVLTPPPRLVAPDADLDPGPRPDPSGVQADSPDLPDGGESAARERLESYLAGGPTGAARYGDLRNDLAADATSRLSPYLRFGCVSANEVVARATAVPGAGELVRQIAWRDFYGQLLAHDPTIAWRDFREPPGDVPPAPEHADELFERWQLGRTGIPLVDAGMRQLRSEGFMHNRARMVTASFLTRRLGIAWQRGAAHFFRWLVDGDPANNSGGWQWVAGTGTDPRRSRSFNPVRQAERFDPDGTYVRRYVSELADVQAPQIFAPWWDLDLLEMTGYPAPILEVPSTTPKASRSDALTLPL
ncbi:MAG: deoxyribodipyrimidine photo-lyase [Actinomycetota bacterium]